jgi:arylsulfatase A-like enzyme
MQPFPSLNEKHERYLNCMHYIDGYIRDLVQELRDRGLLDKTVFVVLGDHGETFGEHGSFLRADGLHEELLQIPMIIRLPSAARRTGHIGGLPSRNSLSAPRVLEPMLALGQFPGDPYLSLGGAAEVSSAE